MEVRRKDPYLGLDHGLEMTGIPACRYHGRALTTCRVLAAETPQGTLGSLGCDQTARP